MFFSPSLSVLLLLPGQRLFTRNRCVCARAAAFFLHQRSRHSCFANRDVICGLWVFNTDYSFSPHPRMCNNNYSTVGLAFIYCCFYRFILRIAFEWNLRYLTKSTRVTLDFCSISFSTFIILSSIYCFLFYLALKHYMSISSPYMCFLLPWIKAPQRRFLRRRRICMMSILITRMWKRTGAICSHCFASMQQIKRSTGSWANRGEW